MFVALDSKTYTDRASGQPGQGTAIGRVRPLSVSTNTISIEAALSWPLNLIFCMFMSHRPLGIESHRPKARSGLVLARSV